MLTLTINRADSSNAIPYYVRDRLIQYFEEAHSDLEVRAIVLTGAGRAALLHRLGPPHPTADGLEARGRAGHGGRAPRSR